MFKHLGREAAYTQLGGDRRGRRPRKNFFPAEKLMEKFTEFDFF